MTGIRGVISSCARLVAALSIVKEQWARRRWDLGTNEWIVLARIYLSRHLQSFQRVANILHSPTYTPSRIKRAPTPTCLHSLIVIWTPNFWKSFYHLLWAVRRCCRWRSRQIWLVLALKPDTILLLEGRRSAVQPINGPGGNTGLLVASEENSIRLSIRSSAK